ncbi:DUF4436 domain-containing protein [Mycobacterium montefiorense]|uniref:DUF4436 domain-containing protein n=1 Tax=Mycobacterium montefiorense TaxID=154654 RepID=A0AA37PMS2_9MYCO|nr:DUF4436 domain-containing protein [Mycobacterium montefiorense]GBG36870.1 DUF4436 domain-containing protein [Mycobacterium montefiorense]GKU37777.1 DUF4436 domain-containing protein [Mycobacterium montefiorense]GKU42735.1 DUF4436 domain-containing protein [Mycobacterium montefiorense]GKU46388.1 DUF4436 domain-containing protein [Mycobacterium montefiorense]GKU51028.1 DUF4436 domain-containing protein [Mycobacterium montefiorense]
MLGLVVFFVATYITTIALYARSGCGCPLQLTQGAPAADGTTVTIDFLELQSMQGALHANVTITPGPGLVDPVTRGLNADLAVVVHSAVTPSKRSWTKGMLPGEYPVPLTISGDPSQWPFDTFQSGPITVDLIYGSQRPEQVPVKFVDRVSGWALAVAGAGSPQSPYRVELRRAPSIAAFAAVVIVVMLALAGAASFVAIQTARNRRKFQPPMTTWYAAMLFAVIPLRNALPDAPPIGSWVDVTITLWVIVTLVMSMLLYVYCWWRHLRPEPENSA